MQVLPRPRHLKMYDEASKLSIILCNLKLKKERIIIRLIDKMQEFLRAYFKTSTCKESFKFLHGLCRGVYILHDFSFVEHYDTFADFGHVYQIVTGNKHRYPLFCR